MKIKTSELTGPALDWAVAKCLPDEDFIFDGPHAYLPDPNGNPIWFEPSSDWSQGGPIIEREGIDIIHANDSEWVWRATLFLPVPAPYNTPQEVFRFGGNTPLIAAMRCYVASKLGDEVEIPEELA